MNYKHKEGPGLKVVGDPKKKWYGPGYCGICGTRGELLVPVRVRWWDCDDGWKTGVLCEYCGRDVAYRGPRPTDYACLKDDPDDMARRQDLIDELLAGDDDGAYSIG